MKVIDKRAFNEGTHLKDIMAGSVIDITDWDGDTTSAEERFAIVLDSEDVARPDDSDGCLPIVTFGGRMHWPAEMECFVVVEAQIAIVGNQPL